MQITTNPSPANETAEQLETYYFWQEEFLNLVNPETDMDTEGMSYYTYFNKTCLQNRIEL